MTDQDRAGPGDGPEREPEPEPASEASYSSLGDELRGLGRGIRIPDVDGQTMAERVLAQLLAEAVPVPAVPGRAERLRHWARRRWRALTVALSGLLVVLVLTPPVRATVVDWFGFGGVEVRYDPSTPPRPGEPVPWCDGAVSLAEAERRAGFRPRVPGGLGDPDAVSVAEGPTGHPGRSVVSLCWRERGGTVRLDEFPAKLDLGFAKQARLMPEWVDLNGATGLWFAEPHLLRFAMTDDRGEGWRPAERTAGPTLLWTTTDLGTTLRLEGVGSMQRAREIAESTP